MGEFSSCQKGLKGGRFLPKAAPPPKEGGAKKKGDFVSIVLASAKRGNLRISVIVKN